MVVYVLYLFSHILPKQGWLPSRKSMMSSCVLAFIRKTMASISQMVYTIFSMQLMVMCLSMMKVTYSLLIPSSSCPIPVASKPIIVYRPGRAKALQKGKNKSRTILYISAEAEYFSIREGYLKISVRYCSISVGYWGTEVEYFANRTSLSYRVLRYCIAFTFRESGEKGRKSINYS